MNLGSVFPQCVISKVTLTAKVLGRSLKWPHARTRDREPAPRDIGPISYDALKSLFVINPSTPFR
jgi:hypothetical protein